MALEKAELLNALEVIRKVCAEYAPKEKINVKIKNNPHRFTEFCEQYDALKKASCMKCPLGTAAGACTLKTNPLPREWVLGEKPDYVWRAFGKQERMWARDRLHKYIAEAEKESDNDH